jgi:hypothetical protein
MTTDRLAGEVRAGGEVTCCRCGAVIVVGIYVGTDAYGVWLFVCDACSRRNAPQA